MTVGDSTETQLLQKIATAMRAGNSAAAAELAQGALTRGQCHPLLYLARATHLDVTGKSADALADFLEARRLSPRDPMVINGAAICLGRMGRLAESVEAFDASLALDPALATTHFHKGWALETNGLSSRAAESYARAKDLVPSYAAAWAGLARVAEKLEDWDTVTTAATRTLALDPHQRRAVLSLALADMQGSRSESAEMRLRTLLSSAPVLPAHLRIAALGLLADTLDRQGRIDEAFATYVAENEERGRAISGDRFFDVAALVEGVSEHFSRTYPGRWTLESAGPDDGGPYPEHVFLLGFPRTGTTLLEQVLFAHPDVATLEESDTLDGAAERYLLDGPSRDRFTALSGAALAEERRIYWQKVRCHSPRSGARIFVDKLPLNTIKLPLIAKLFPQAKIILAVRDPRDVVFSCFRRHLPLNASTAPFLSLDKTARFFDRVMTLANLCRERLPLGFHVHRHEAFVADFRTELRALCDFLGLSWTDAFDDFASVARQRAIKSVSAPQVRRGLYGDGEGHWRRYRHHLDPVLSLLEPWVEMFGYEAD